MDDVLKLAAKLEDEARFRAPITRGDRATAEWITQALNVMFVLRDRVKGRDAEWRDALRGGATNAEHWKTSGPQDPAEAAIMVAAQNRVDREYRAHQLAQIQRLEKELAVASSRMRSAEAGCELATGKYAEISLDSEDTIASLSAQRDAAMVVAKAARALRHCVWEGPPEERGLLGAQLDQALAALDAAVGCDKSTSTG
jgi:hypothetical protein